MPRIPDDTLARLKLEVSCQSVLEARGHRFRPHGADVVTTCPFHDDKTPSLVVTPGKNLWHCLGACQTGGDVIALVRRLDGVSFRHAVELLLDGLPHLAAEAGAGDGRAVSAAAPPQRSTVAKLPCPLDGLADDAGLLVQVVDYYHGRLLPAGSAGRVYLAERGLDDDALIRQFRLGLADRSLGLRLPNKQRADGAALRSRLEGLGVYRASGHEHFNGSVVVPVFDGAGQVAEMYGRKITSNLRAGTPKHCYLPGPHRGVWNAGGLVNDAGRVVLCEALIDAMTCWVQGVRSVTAAYGTGGFTADHLAALHAARTRDVVLAYDADAAGDAAADRLADRLIGDGFTAYRLRLPIGQDVNAAALAAGADARAWLADALDAAQWLGGAPRVAGAGSAAAAVATAAPAGAESAALPLAAPAVAGANADDRVVVDQCGDDVHLAIDGRRYRVRGLERAGSLTALKVQLRLQARDGFHLDTVDLYQARPRAVFASAAAVACGLSVDLVRRDLSALLLRIEGLHEEQLKAKAAQAAGTPQPVGPALSAAERDDAVALLRAPDLLDRIAADLEACGLIGETLNKQVAYLAATSRLLATPLAVVVQSSSAAGKTALMDAVLGCMPDEVTRQFTTLSEKALYYLNDVPLQHTILGIRETDGMAAASYHLKVLQSDGVLSQLVPQKDPQTGQLVTTEFRVEGPVMLFLTTTAADDDLDPELLNRCVKLTVDESAAQTARIQTLQRSLEAGGRAAARRRRDAIQARHRNAQRLLEQLDVRNPFAPQLTFNAQQARLRRDHAKYLTMIRAVALLHQRDGRPITTAEDGTRSIDVTQRDIQIANRLAGAVLGRSLDDLTGMQRAVLEALHRFVQACGQSQGCAAEDVRFTRRDFRESMQCRWSASQLAAHLAALVRLEYLVPESGRNGSIYRYRLVWAGQGADGSPCVLGLVDANRLKDATAVDAKSGGGGPETCIYDDDLPGSRDHLPGGFRYASGSLPGTFRSDELPETLGNTAEYWLSQPSVANIAFWAAHAAIVVPYMYRPQRLPPLGAEVA